MNASQLSAFKAEIHKPIFRIIYSRIVKKKGARLRVLIKTYNVNFIDNIFCQYVSFSQFLKKISQILDLYCACNFLHNKRLLYTQIIKNNLLQILKNI
jgi:hypothetical protein